MGSDHESENLQRYSFTIPRELIESIDNIIENTDSNRSMVVREALSHWVDHSTKAADVAGTGVATISYLYDHHDTRVMSELMEVQHSFDELIQTTSHVHLDHNLCFEITICKGELSKIKTMGELIRAVKGTSSFYVNYAVSEVRSQ